MSEISYLGLESRFVHGKKLVFGNSVQSFTGLVMLFLLNVVNLHQK